MLGAPETRVRMEEDRLSTKMEEAAIRTLEHWTDLWSSRLENNQMHLAARSSRTSRPVGCNWRALAGHRAEQVNVEAWVGF